MFAMKTIPPNPKDDDSLNGLSDSSSLQLFDNESFQQQLSSANPTRIIFNMHSKNRN